MPILESLAYALARGAVRAWLDCLREAAAATPEALTAADTRHAERLRAAIAGLPAAGPHGGPADHQLPPAPGHGA